MKHVYKLLAFMLAFICAIGSYSTVNAATKISLSKSGTKAKVLTKTGTYNITNKSDFEYGYVKFKALKSGSYTFTFNDLSYSGEKKDMNTDKYWDPFSSAEFNRRVSVALQTGSDKSGWKNINFDTGDVYDLINLHETFYLCYLNGDYDSIAEAVNQFADGKIAVKDVLKYTQNGAPEIQLTVKMKKGAVIRIYTQGAKTKTTCTLKIKKK